MPEQKYPHAWADTLPSQFGPYPAPPESPEFADTPVDATVTPVQPKRAATSIVDTRLPWYRWIGESLRATFLTAPRTEGAAPTPWQLLCLVLLASALQLGAARLQVPGPADFNVRGWLAPWWSNLVLLWCAWWGMHPRRHSSAASPAPVAAWFVITAWAPVLPTLLLYGLVAWAAHWPAHWAPAPWSQIFWGLHTALAIWAVGVLIIVGARFIRSFWRTVVFAAAVIGVISVGVWQVTDQPWEAATPVSDRPSLSLSQPLFEAQQALWQKQVQALPAQREGVVDVYGLVFAPYAHEDVFRRESTMVSDLLQERFDAHGRVLHLLNHAETANSHAWATPENLQRAVAALGERMDRDNDVLVVYLTSHGAQNHQLAASHWPLKVPPIRPDQLRKALDEAGIRNRVIAVSACYSGGWIDSLATDSTLIMTAADATHTSYGCGTRSDLTFFGRAVFHEQLRLTHSFAQAFAKAVPVIAQREVDAGKSDGFSNPQIRVGTAIEPILKALSQRLDGIGAPAVFTP